MSLCPSTARLIQPDGDQLFFFGAAAAILSGPLKTAIRGHFKTDQREDVGSFRFSFIERVFGRGRGVVAP